MSGPSAAKPARRAPAGETFAMLSMRVQPRASRDGVTRLEDGTFKVRLTAPPVDGAANEALVRFLAERLGLPRSSVEIVSGHTGRQKIVRISGISQADAERSLNTEGK